MTFPEADVQQALLTFAGAKLDIDDADNAEPRQRYGDIAVPSLAVVDADGHLVHRWVGALEADALVRELHRATRWRRSRTAPVGCSETLRLVTATRSKRGAMPAMPRWRRSARAARPPARR